MKTHKQPKKVSYKEAFLKGAATGAAAGAGLSGTYLGLAALERRNPESPVVTGVLGLCDAINGFINDFDSSLLEDRDILRDAPVRRSSQVAMVAGATAIGAVVTGTAAMVSVWSKNKKTERLVKKAEQLNKKQASPLQQENQTHAERLAAKSPASSSPAL